MSILTEVIQEVEQEYEVNIVSGDRTMMNSLARKATINALRFRYTTIELAKVLNRKHSTICHYQTTHGMDMKLEFYKNVYTTAKSLYEEKVETPPVSREELTKLVQDVKEKLFALETKMKQIP